MFQIDPYGRTPVYAQIIAEVERYVLSGVYKPKDQVPSVRALALSSGVNPNTIQKAYMQMERDGILKSAPGRGRFVTEDAKSIIKERRREQLLDLRKSLQAFAQAGITRQEIEKCLDEVYQGRENDTD